MLHKSIFNKLIKNGYLVSHNGKNLFSAVSKNEHAVIEWYKHDEKSVCITVRYIEDKDDLLSDYHGGSFYHSINSAIDALNRLDLSRENKKKK